MEKINYITVVVLVVGLAVAYFYLGGGDETDGHNHSHNQMEAEAPFPSVDLIVTKDPKSGWNAQIVPQNFSFAPERASTEGRAGEGHAHIYVDGVKINRVYGEWYYLGELDAGEREISVRLSTNDHKEITKNGIPIGDKEIIQVSK